MYIGEGGSVCTPAFAVQMYTQHSFETQKAKPPHPPLCPLCPYLLRNPSPTSLAGASFLSSTATYVEAQQGEGGRAGRGWG